jgi:cytochrome d ubiquinol oxidase subunit I
MDKLQLDNPITVPNVLSFLTYQRWTAEVKGLNEFPRDYWPDNIPLLYFAYHIMVGLGTILLAVMAISAFLLARGRLFANRPALWLLLIMTPFPYIATTAGWMTAALGRQPWLIYGVMRTAAGVSRKSPRATDCSRCSASWASTRCWESCFCSWSGGRLSRAR